MDKPGAHERTYTRVAWRASNCANFVTSYATGLRRKGSARAEAFAAGTCFCAVGHFKTGVLRVVTVVQFAAPQVLCPFGVHG